MFEVGLYCEPDYTVSYASSVGSGGIWKKRITFTTGRVGHRCTRKSPLVIIFCSTARL